MARCEPLPRTTRLRRDLSTRSRRCRARLAATTHRCGLGRHPLADRARWTRTHARTQRRLVARMRPRRCSGGVQHGRLRPRRWRGDALRHARAAGTTAFGDTLDRACVVPAVLRTGRRQRPRLAVDARRTRRRQLHRQRPEGLVLRREVLQLGHPDGAHAAARSVRRTTAHRNTRGSRSSCARWICPESRSDHSGR